MSKVHMEVGREGNGGDCFSLPYAPPAPTPVVVNVFVGDEKGELRKEVRDFSQQMEIELKINDHKGSWHGARIEELLEHLKDEVRELEESVNLHYSPACVLSEAADVANMAMMVADNYKIDYAG